MAHQHLPPVANVNILRVPQRHKQDKQVSRDPEGAHHSVANSVAHLSTVALGVGVGSVAGVHVAPGLECRTDGDDVDKEHHDARSDATEDVAVQRCENRSTREVKVDKELRWV
jgi:hypothetical protein